MTFAESSFYVDNDDRDTAYDHQREDIQKYGYIPSCPWTGPIAFPNSSEIEAPSSA